MQTLPDEPLDLSKPCFLQKSETSYGSAQGIVTKNNELLRQVFDSTQEHYPKASARIPRLIATVRWSILQLPRLVCANRVGIGQGTYSSLEKEPVGSRMQNRETTYNLLDFWKREDIPLAAREQLLECIEEHVATYDGPVMGFYARVGHEVGGPRFIATTNLKPMEMNKRRQGKVSTRYAESYNMVKNLYAGKSKEMSTLREIRHGQSRKAWSLMNASVLQKRGLEEPYIELMTALEFYCIEHMHMPLSCEALTSNALGLNFSKTRDFMQGDIVPWSALEEIAQCVLLQDRFDVVKAGWLALEQEEAARPSFKREVVRQCNEQDITSRELTYCLNVRHSPHVQRAVENWKTFRPSKYILETLEHCKHTMVAPPKTIVALVAPDDEQYQRLRNLFVNERKRFYKRSNRFVNDPAFSVSMELEWNGVSEEEAVMEFLKRQKSFMKEKQLTERLRLIQQGTYVPQERELQQIIRAINFVGDVKKETALKRQGIGESVPGHCLEFSTVAEATVKLIEGVSKRGEKEIQALNRIIREHAPDNRWRIGRGMLSRMERGEECPSLPLIENMITAVGGQMNENVRRDWFCRYPEQLWTRNRFPLARALPRLLVTLMHSLHVHTLAFHEEAEIRTDIDGVIAELEWGDWPRWHHIANILSAAGVQRYDFVWKLAQYLYENDDNVKGAVEHLHPDIQKKNIELHPVHFVGITVEELENASQSLNLVASPQI